MSLKESRQRHILGRIKAEPEIKVSDLARELNVSSMTIRRDLRILEDMGKVTRVFGGAVNAQEDIEAPDRRRHANQGAKRAIAAQSERLVNAGSHVFVGAGSTNLALARRLAAHSNIRLYTNCIYIAQALGSESQIDINVFGGSLWRSADSFIGVETLEQIERRQFDLAFLGISAVDIRQGFIEPTDWQACLARALRRHAATLVIQADHSKFKPSAGIRALSFEEVDVLVTDRGLKPEVAEALSSLKVLCPKAA